MEDCKYCNVYHSERYPIRGSFADDNYCEFINGEDCASCDGCSYDKNYFEISYYGDYMSVTHWREINSTDGTKVVGAQNSERIHRNYCHMCGRKLI